MADRRLIDANALRERVEAQTRPYDSHRNGGIADVLALIDAAPTVVPDGWWHPAACIDIHDADHNCLDEGGSIIGWRESAPPWDRPDANRECSFCGDPVYCSSCYEEDVVRAAEARYEQ